MGFVNKIEVGERIKKIRMNYYGKKLTQQEFAELLDPVVDKSAVRKWEKGLNLPNENRINQIAELGNVSVEYLFFGEKQSSMFSSPNKSNEKYSIDKKAVGQRIKNIRRNYFDKPISQSRFGELFNPAANRSSVQKWESGDILPNNERLRKIAELGNISIDFLLYGGNSNSELNEQQIELLENMKHVYSWQHSHALDLIFYLIEPDDSMFSESAIWLFRSLNEEEQLQVIYVFISWVLDSSEEK